MLERRSLFFTSAVFTLLLGCSEAEPLALSTVAPSSGPEDGGTVVTLKGEAFENGLSVTFGGKPASQVTVVDPETITAVTPPHVAGLVPVAVENPDGEEAALPDAFTYLAPPPPEVVCTVAITPAFGALEVDVVSSITVDFSHPVDEMSLASAFGLTRTGSSAPVPFDQTVLSSQQVLLTPQASLAFFEDYSVTVDGVVTADGQVPCFAEGGVFSTRDPEPEPRPLRPAAANDVVVIGDTALVASASYRGIQIYDVSVPSSPALTGELLTEGPPLGIAVQGDRAYVPAGAFGIYILDVASPSTPTLLGVAGTPGEAAEVAPFVQDGSTYLAVADRSGGFRILDVTEPEGAKDVAALQPSGDPKGDVMGLALDGELAVVAQGTNGFALIDISTPALPVVLTSRPSEAVDETFGAPRWVNDVELGDGVVFLALYSFGVQAFDVTAPAAPTFLDHAVGPQGLCTSGCPDEIWSLEYEAGSLYAASAMSGAARFQLAGSTLSLHATLPLKGRIYSVGLDDEANLWVGGERGLGLFPKDAADGAPPTYAEEAGWGSTQGILARPGYLYAAASSRGLETYDLQDPLKPTLLSVAATAGAEADVGLLNIQAVGDYLIVGDGRAGISVFDATNPAAPTLTGTIPSADTVGAMVPGNGRVFACDGTYALWTIDVSDPANPTHETLQIAPNVGGCYGLSLVGTTLYVAGSLGLGVYDVASGTPALANTLILPADDLLFGIAAQGDYLYATTYVRDYEGTYGTAQRLVVFDISDPANPVRVFKSADLGGVIDLSIRGDKLFVAGRGQGLWIWGLANPAEPELEGFVDFPGDVFRMSHAGGDAEILYVSQRAGGVGVVELGKLPQTSM